jgi:hypothetical protein
VGLETDQAVYSIIQEISEHCYKVIEYNVDDDRV